MERKKGADSYDERDNTVNSLLSLSLFFVSFRFLFYFFLLSQQVVVNRGAYVYIGARCFSIHLRP